VVSITLFSFQWIVPNWYRTHDEEMKNCSLLLDEGIEEQRSTFWHMDYFLSSNTGQVSITWCPGEKNLRAQDSEAATFLVLSTTSPRLLEHWWDLPGCWALRVRVQTSEARKHGPDRVANKLLPWAQLTWFYVLAISLWTEPN
jgi:hypothetical protein